MKMLISIKMFSPRLSSLKPIMIKRIQELEVQHAHIKQKISKLMLQQKPDPQRLSNLPFMHHRAIGDSDTKIPESRYFNIILSMGQAVHVFDREYRIRFWLA